MSTATLLILAFALGCDEGYYISESCTDHDLFLIDRALKKADEHFGSEYGFWIEAYDVTDPYTDDDRNFIFCNHDYAPKNINAICTGERDIYIFTKRIKNDDTYMCVLLHELGHSAGLEHSTDPANVMYPVCQRPPVTEY